MYSYAQTNNNFTATNHFYWIVKYIFFELLPEPSDFLHFSEQLNDEFTSASTVWLKCYQNGEFLHSQ